MTAVEWDRFDDPLCDDGLRIEKLDDEGSAWSLSAAPLPIGVWESDLGKRFTTRRVARAAAVRLEVLRLRRVKQARHLVLTGGFAVLAVVSYQIMAMPGQWYRVEWFAAATVAVIVALSEALSAFLMVIDDGWDYRYEVPRITFVDRAIAAIVLRYPGRRRPIGVAEAPRVRIVEPLAGVERAGM